MLGQSWGIHESTVCRIVHRIEDVLISSKKFRLPGKKALYQSKEKKLIALTLVSLSLDCANYRNKLVKEKKFNQQTFWKYVKKYSGYLDYQERLAIALQVINS